MPMCNDMIHDCAVAVYSFIKYTFNRARIRPMHSLGKTRATIRYLVYKFSDYIIYIIYDGIASGMFVGAETKLSIMYYKSQYLT